MKVRNHKDRAFDMVKAPMFHEIDWKPAGLSFSKRDSILEAHRALDAALRDLVWSEGLCRFALAP